ncbi:MAG TPA: hypothetical protein PLX31_21430, partial [Gemmatimonadaceae bacterium]|nr:hypothetical protein [Gemmatimonadaceae bacterium]
MLGDLFKRFRSSERPAVAAAGASTARPTTAERTPPSAVPTVAPTTLPPVPPDADAREMQGWLELDVRTRVAELH